MKKKGEDTGTVAAREWSGVSSSQITGSTVHATFAKTTVHPFTTDLRWSTRPVFQEQDSPRNCQENCRADD